MDYEQRVLTEFRRLKQPKDLHSASGNILALHCNNGFLIPLSELHASDDALIEILGKWAKQKNYTFPIQFDVTRESTARWLNELVLADPGRIMFLVNNAKSVAVGHVGFINCINKDKEMWLANILRGVDRINPGIMQQAVNAMLSWAYYTIQPERIGLRVLADNKNAIDFYKQASFLGHDYIEYSKKKVGGRVELVDRSPENIKSPTVRFLIMFHDREDDNFINLHRGITDS